MSPDSLEIQQGAIPPELDRWSWGACLLNVIWGIGNRVPIALFTLIPVIGWFGMPIILGLRGNRWAWENGYWRSREQFVRVQRGWAIAGFASLITWLAMLMVLVSLVTELTGEDGPMPVMKDAIREHQLVQGTFGTPIEFGWLPSGSVNRVGPDGNASLSFSISGPTGEGTVYGKAIYRLGEWELTELYVKAEDGPVIQVVPK